MRIEKILISKRVEDKLHSKYGVTRDEIEELFWYSGYKIVVKRAQRDTYMAFGRTLSGRYLAVVFARKGAGTIRIVTARDMTRVERRRYRKG